MAKTWVLDTETKGTGAHVVPLEAALHRARAEPDLATVRLNARRPPAPVPEPPAPLRFKLVDVMSAAVLAEGVDAQATVELLGEMGSVLDARVYVWMPHTGRWRLLTLDEQKTLWGFRKAPPADVRPDAGADSRAPRSPAATRPTSRSRRPAKAARRRRSRAAGSPPHGARRDRES
jgi:hypothetical protein